MVADPPEIFLIGVNGEESNLSDYILSDGPISHKNKKWGISVTGPTELLLREMGLWTLARLAVRRSEKLKKLHENALDQVLETIRSLDAIPDFVLVADDCATYEGPLLPKWYLEDVYLVSHELLTDEIRSIGAEAFLHADGNYGSYFREIGRVWDLVHPLDVYPRGDLTDYRNWLRLAAKIRPIIGGKVATGIAFELGSEELILKAVREFLEIGMEDVVLSNFHPPLKELNVRRIVEMIRDALPRS